MPIDPNIILGLKPTVGVDPQELLMRGAQMRNAQMQQAAAAQQLQTGALELQQRQQAMADDQAMRDAFSASGGDIEKALPEIMKRNPKIGLQLGEQLFKQRTERTNAQLKELELGKNRAEMFSQLAGSVRAANFSPEAVQQGLSKAVKLGLIPAEKAQQAFAMAQENPAGFAQYIQQLENDGLTAVQRADLTAKELTAQNEALKLRIAQLLEPSTVAKGKAEAIEAGVKANVATATQGDVIAEKKAAAVKAGNEAVGSEIVGNTGMTKAQLAADNRMRQATAQGLQNTQINRAIQIGNQFDNEPIVKNYNVVAEARDFVKRLGTGKAGSPSDDQGLLYAFAKVMDPNSVVREGEYATVQKYAQSWADNYGFKAQRIFENTPFLTEKARRVMKDTIEKRAQAATKNYENVYGEYARRIEQNAGVKDGKSFLTDYGKAFAGGAAVPSAEMTATGPNGEKIVLRGGKWVPQ